MREKVDFLPTTRFYKDMATGEKVKSITEWAISKGYVTLNIEYTGTPDEIKNGATLFHELTVFPSETPESIQFLLDENNRTGRNEPIEIAQAIESSLEKAWEPQKFHLVIHSSGYDSRIISYTILKLRQKHSDSWLGNVLFFCYEPEGEAFKNIMKFQGWSEDQYHVFNEGIEAGEYYAGLADFNRFHEWVNDAQAVVYADPLGVEQLVSLGKIPVPLSEVQFIGGFGGNECLRLTQERLLEYFFFHISGAKYATYPYADIIRPFVSYDVLNLINIDLGKSGKKGEQRAEPRRINLVEISKLVLPEPVRRLIPRFIKELVAPKDTRRKSTWIEQSSWERYLTTLDYKVKTGILDYLSQELKGLPRGPEPFESNIRNLSERVRNKCAEDFAGSWYYKNFVNDPTYAKEVPESLVRQDWWRYFAIASICEHLVKNGVTITTQ